jgi:hypothetical protein
MSGHAFTSFKRGYSFGGGGIQRAEPRLERAADGGHGFEHGHRALDLAHGGGVPRVGGAPGGKGLRPPGGEALVALAQPGRGLLVEGWISAGAEIHR